MQMHLDDEHGKKGGAPAGKGGSKGRRPKEAAPRIGRVGLGRAVAVRADHHHRAEEKAVNDQRRDQVDPHVGRKEDVERRQGRRQWPLDQNVQLHNFHVLLTASGRINFLKK